MMLQDNLDISDNFSYKAVISKFSYFWLNLLEC